MCLRNIQQPPGGDCGDQGDAPLPNHGGVQLPHGGQVCRHAEGEGAEEGAADPDQSVELGKC